MPPLISPLSPHDPAAVAALRARLRAIEPYMSHGVLPFGDDRVDHRLPGGGLPLGQLHEVAAEGVDGETGSLAAGFLACLASRIGGTRPVFWIAPSDDLYAPGLIPFGLDPGRLVMVRSPGDDGTLAAMETVLRAGAAAAVIGEVGRFARTPSRRLQLACLKHGVTGFVLRRWPWGKRQQATADREATASATRWRIAPAPSDAPYRDVGIPRWEVALDHVRGGLSGAWIMEVARNATGELDAPHPLRVVAELADAASAPSRSIARAG